MSRTKFFNIYRGNSSDVFTLLFILKSQSRKKVHFIICSVVPWGKREEEGGGRSFATPFWDILLRISQKDLIFCLSIFAHPQSRPTFWVSLYASVHRHTITSRKAKALFWNTSYEHIHSYICSFNIIPNKMFHYAVKEMTFVIPLLWKHIKCFIMSWCCVIIRS